MSNEPRIYYLWLEGEYDSQVSEHPGDSPDRKYAKAYEAAKQRDCPCSITDDTGLADDQSGVLIAIVHPDGEVTDGTGLHLFHIGERIEAYRKSRVKVAVVCRNAEGAVDFHTCTPEVTEAERQEGKHYELACENAEENGYEGPFLPFDAEDPAVKALAAVATWFETP